MAFPDFRPDPAMGNGRCAVHIDDTRCGAPAAWHLNLGPTPDGAQQLSLACTPHMELIRTEYVYADRHPYGPSCGQVSWDACAAESRWQDPDGDRPHTLESSTRQTTNALDALREQLAFDLHPDLQGPDEDPNP
ncbi:hypothetical protein DV517_62130 [Streptomyces sp. S816]|uniref:hypothetical protein n=1 Tax=Streptomyces sp. S816 TaxID=2283197 RepID=UPI00109C69F6|nr:hypothetical protein [Streptomyces sp. S816]TGZ14730.1 hypothetical protein DV517_62130 [Streptomyces sp. S816]